MRPLFARLLDAVPDDDQDAGQDLHMVGIASDAFHPALHIGVEALTLGQRALSGKHHLRGFGCELPARLRRAGLHDERPALHRTGDVQRPAHGEEFAAMVQGVEPVGIEELPRPDIPREGVVGPAVPQAGHYIVILAGPAVTLGVRHLPGLAEVERGIRIRGRDEIPARAPVADVIERCETPGDRIGRLERGRCGCDEAEAVGDHRQRRQQRERIERGDGSAALERLHRHVEHRKVIGHEERIEASAFERPGERDQMAEVEIGVGRAARIAPPRRMDADRAHERP